MSGPEGTYNFRDTGGMPLSSGGATRSGILYRSDALSGLTARGLEQLADTDIGVVVDLRTPMERQMAPDRLPASRAFEVVELALVEGAVTGLAQQAMQAGIEEQNPDAAAAAVQQALAHIPDVGHVYVAMLEHGAEAFAETARRVTAAESDRAPAVLVHCTAGKDRTGVAVALMLDAVGVDRAALIADYVSSEQHLSGAWAEGMYALITRMGVPLSPELRELVAGAPSGAIESALSWVDGEHGGSSAYLRSGGLTEHELSALRGRLTG